MRSLVLLAALVLLASLSAVSGQSYYTMCYTTQQTNPNSPTTQWAVSIAAYLTVNDSASALTQGYFSGYLALFPASRRLSGYPVLGASGTRTVYALGTSQTNSITGVAPVNAYNGNDNIIRNQVPYLDNLVHSITFTLGSNLPPLFALGTIASNGQVAGNPMYVNINNYTYPLYGGSGVQESDDPPNDGSANVMVSTFTLTAGGQASGTPTCPNTVSAPAQQNGFGSQMTWSFCYTFTGGGNFATTNSQQWFVTGSGTITTTGYAGTTTKGRQAYLITGISGTRTYTNPGTGAAQSVSIVGVGGPNTQQAVAYNSEQFDYLYQAGLQSNVANNLLYPTYPYFDQWGVNIITNGVIGNEDASNLTVNAYRLYVDQSSWSLNEWVTDFVGAGAWFFTYSGTSIVVPFSQSSPSALLPQCSPSYGPTVLFQFCYYIDNLSASPSSFTYAYGTIQANGPVMRNGRMAYTAQTMNGVRSITTGGASGTTTSAAIIYLEWIQSDLNWGFINNNLIYQSAPYIDQQGIIFATSAGPVFANGAVPANTIVYYGYTDVAVAANTVGNVSTGNAAGIYEQSVLTPTLYSQGTATSAFNVAPLAYGSTPSSATCAYPSGGAGAPLITSISTTTVSFCYLVTGADNGGWQAYTSGTITYYNTPIMNGGLLAYAVANITGTRTYQQTGGVQNVVQITGINSNNRGASGWEYDNLFYAQAPNFDSDGLVFDFSGTAMTSAGPVQGDGQNVFNIFVYTGFFQEEAYVTSNLTVYADTVAPQKGSFSITMDGGSSGMTTNGALAACGAPLASTAVQITTMSFCYAISNNFATSPFQAWAVTASGTFTVITSSLSVGVYQQQAEYPGYIVTGGSGTRTVYSAQSSQPVTQTIQVAPINTYNTNDNILQPGYAAYGTAAPYPLVSLHGITFSTNGPTALPTGNVTMAGGQPLTYLTLIGWQSPAPATTGGSMPITEADLPLNDGVTGQLTAVMYVVQGNTPPTTCTSSPSPVQIPTLSSLTAATASTVNYQFCYYFTGWDHLGTNWSITTTGVLTTSGYLGTTTTNQQARMITAASGQRVLTLGNGNTFTTPLQGLGGFNAYQFASETMANEQFSSYFESNNVLYMNWPYFDQYGLSLQGSGVFYEPNGGGLNTGNTALKLFIDPSTYDVAEWLIDWAQNTYYVGEAGSLQVSPSSSVSNVAQFNAQCGANYGSTVTYQWCYYLDRSGQNNNGYYVQAYGILTANGPVTRQGMTAYTVQTMSGVRTYMNLSSGVSSTNPILALQYINYDEGSGGGSGLTFWVTNDNYIFGSSPYLSENGLLYGTFPTPNNPMFPQGMGSSTDIQVNVNQTFRNTQNLALQENSVGSESTSTNLASLLTVSPNFGFSMTPVSQGSVPSTSQCSSKSSRFSYPSVQTSSFCYVITGSLANGGNYTISSSGTITTYQVSVTSNLQYPGAGANIIAGVTGYRQWQNNSAAPSSVMITGLGSNWYAKDGWNYDQLLYNNSYYFDSYGLLFTFSGTAWSPTGPIYGDVNAAVINIFNDGSSFQEEGWTGQFSVAYDSGVINTGSSVFNIVADGGSSYNSGSLLRNQCGYGGSIPAGFGPNASYSSGSSGLSGGAIAGIVIGVVVGVLLLCVLAFLAVVGCNRNKGAKSGETSGVGKYSNQSEESRVEQSQVELQDANNETS